MSGIGLYVDPNTLHVGIGTDDPGSASLFVGGDINFTGDLKQGGLPFIGSRWERSNLDISYTPGNVGIGTSDTEDARLKVEGDIAFTGRLIQNGIDYQGSKWSQTGSNIDFIQGNVGIGTSSNADARLTVAGDIKLSGYILNEDNEAIWIPGSSVKWRAADTPSIVVPNGISWTPTASSNTAIYRYIGTDITYNFNVIGSAIGLPTTPGADIKLTLPFPIDYTLSAYSTQPIVAGTILVSVTPSGGQEVAYTGYARTSVNSADAMTLVLRYVTGNTDRPLSDMTTAGSPVTVRIQGQVTYTTPIAANNVEIPVTYTPGTFEQDTAGKIIYNGQGAPPQAQFQVVAQSNVPAFTPAMIVDQKSPDDGALIADFRGDGISVASFDTEGNLRLSGQLRNSSNETVWLPGTAVMWKQAVPPAFEGPGGPTIAYSSSNATFRYVGNEIIYNFRLSGNIVAQPLANVDYKLQLQYPILEAAYPMDTIVGDLWLNVSSNQAGGPAATTFKAYAKTIQGSANASVLATRYLNGALDLGLATIAIGSDITLQGTLVYQASNVAANFRVPLAEYRSIIQDQEDNIIINGGGAATRARFEVVETREDVPLMIGHYNPPSTAEIKADTDIFRITRTPIGAGASSNEVFNIRQNGDVRISGNILDANSNATWIPGSTLQWRTGDPPNLSAPTGLSLTYASSNALYRYIGDEFVYNFNVEVGVSGTASDAFADYTLQLSQPVKTALYNTNSEGSIIGSLVVNAYAGGASNTYTGYAKTDPTDPARVILRYINGTYDHPLTDILAGNTIKLQGQITYTTPLIANNVTVPLDYVEAMFVQDQVGNVVLNGDGAAPQAAFDIRQTTSSTVPTIIANQPTSSTGDFMQLRKNNVNVLTISNTGNIMTPGSITASNLRVLGDYVILDTITSNTEQMVITNDGTGPALKVTQTGANSIAEFYDDNNVLAFKIANNGLVGIGTNNPQNTLQVTGTLSVYNSNTLVIDPFKETIMSVPTSVYGHKGDISDDGNTVVISGQVSGSTNVYIYKKVGSSWVQTIVTPSNASYPFGQDVKISSDGNTIVLPCFITKGYFNVLKYNGSSWAETIVTSSYSNASQNFGTPVAVSSDGNTIVAGRSVNPDNNTFYVFKFNGTSWVETVVTASVSSNIKFGVLAISGDGNVIVIVSQYGSTFTNATPYVFKWNGTSWVQMMTLVPSSTTSLRYFASSVSISGNGQLIACGNIIDNSAFLFRWNAGTSTWVEEAKITPTGASAASPYFGTSIDVSLDGNAVAVSADWDGKDGLLKVGAVYIFKWNGTAWLQTQKVTPATAVADLYFGRSVAIASEGSSIVVGSDAQSSAYVFGPESTGMASMERLKIDTSGNVGIGTTNPQSLLHVAGTTRIDGNALIGDSATADAHTVQGSTSMTYSGTSAALTVNQQGTGKLFELQDAGTPQFIVLDGGNVGIGTTNPPYALSLYSATTTKLLSLNTGTPNGSGIATSIGNPMMALGNTSFNTTAPYYYGIGLGYFSSNIYNQPAEIGFVARNNTGGTYGDFYIATRDNGTQANPPVQRMCVTNTGNVGIGTTNPQGKLNVYGNTIIHNNEVATGTPAVTTTLNLFTNTNDGPGYGSKISFNYGLSPTHLVGASISSLSMNAAGKGLVFSTASGNLSPGSEVEVMRLTDAGNVGIGSISPSAQLTVSGGGQNVDATFNTTTSLGGTLLVRDSGAGSLNGGAVVFAANQGSFAAIKGQMSDGTANSVGRLSFFTRNSPSDSTLAKRMMISESGNVSIGNHYPVNKLHVVGDLTGGNAILVENHPASDATSKTLLTGRNHASLSRGMSGAALYWYGTSGTTTYRYSLSISTYFTGQHAGLPSNPDIKANIQNYVGLIVSAADTGYMSYNSVTDTEIMGANAIQINEALPNITISCIDNDPAVFGVISDRKDNASTNTDGTTETDSAPMFGNDLRGRVRVNSIGEGAIWVTNINGNIQNGDYITSSSVPGYGKKQDDDILHNYTVAKTTMSCTFDLNSKKYKCEEFYIENVGTLRKAFIGCTYHCG